MINKLLIKLRHWLGIDSLTLQQQWDHRNLEQLKKDYADQVRMVGVDVALKHDQTVIIFVSRLGQEGGGTVRIVPAHFKEYRELMEFAQFTERSFDPEKVIYDAPRMFNEEIRYRRNRGVW